MALSVGLYQSIVLCFYPRDAMLARVIVIATCLSVRLSVTRWYCVKTISHGVPPLAGVKQGRGG